MLVGAIHAQIVVLEAGLSQQHLDDPSSKVQAQTVSAEPDPEAGESGIINVVAHAQTGALELGATRQPKGKRPRRSGSRTSWGSRARFDVISAEVTNHRTGELLPRKQGSTRGQVAGPVRSGPNMDAHVYPEPEVLVAILVGHGRQSVAGGDRQGECERRRGQGSSGRAARTWGQPLAMLGENAFLTLASPPSPVTQKAARMQRSPAVNAETPAIPEPDNPRTRRRRGFGAAAA
jgi:hypothetical protein